MTPPPVADGVRDPNARMRLPEPVRRERDSRPIGRAALLLLGLTLLITAGCSPLYVLRAGAAQAQLLHARTPIPEVIQDPATDPASRDKLLFAWEARRFGVETLGLDAGEAYTSLVQLESDTLAMVLSAARRDRLEAVTWWFPIVGRVPYRGYFSTSRALREQERLEEEGYDTYLRPTAAFSTLGWFADPLPSILLRLGTVGLVDTILHEISHAHLFLPGRGRFNESFSNFVGGAGAVAFFCGRDGGGLDTVLCGRARDRWSDALDFSRFLDALVEETQDLYAAPGLTAEEVIDRKEQLFSEARTRFRNEVQPSLRSASYEAFLARPLNNATLLSWMLYYHRLPDFQAFLDEHGGDLPAAVRAITEQAPQASDPFDVLPVEEQSADGSAVSQRTPAPERLPDPPGFRGML